MLCYEVPACSSGSVGVVLHEAFIPGRLGFGACAASMSNRILDTQLILIESK